MNDANELRKTIEEMNQAIEQNMEEAADRLIGLFRLSLEECANGGDYFKGAKHICLLIKTISRNFTEFEVGEIIKYKEKELQKAACAKGGKWQTLEESIRYNVHIAQGFTSYTKLLKLQEILEKRGFICRTRQNYEDYYDFVVILPLELE